jgi:hypothetical protein
MEELEMPVFDEIVELEVDEASDVTSLVVHRNAKGVVYCCHSPLERGPLRCTLCETPGTRVYVS